MFYLIVYTQAAIYILFGVTHFTNQAFFEAIIPDWLPNKKFINLFSGASEILMGLGLILPVTRSYTAWVLMLFLVLVFPANVVQIQQWAVRFNKPEWVFWVLRTPIQIVAIYGVWLLIEL